MHNRARLRILTVLIPLFVFVSILLVSPSSVQAQAFVSPLPSIIVPEHPAGIIPMQRSDFSLSGFQTAPLTFEVRIIDATNALVPDDYYGPNTYFMVDITLRNPRGEVVPGAIDSIPTQNGIARFEGIVLQVEPDVYEATITVRIVFAVDGLGSTFLTLGSTFGGQYMIGVQPTPTPTATATINPNAGTPNWFLTYQAGLNNIATGLATTPQPTQFCPPSDPFNCNFPTQTATSTPNATATSAATLTPVPTALAIPSATSTPDVSPPDTIFTITFDERGGTVQNEVSGPSGDTTDIIDFGFVIGAITQSTTYTVTLTCPVNNLAAATVVATGATIACGRSGTVAVDPVNSVFRVVVTSLAVRDQVRTPYVMTIAPSR
ncbi:MAG: hypothetical protein IPM16_14925 [Chloroflexi bacterium]|nr:hypothetical protein [Chloroflexota bacterium]